MRIGEFIVARVEADAFLAERMVRRLGGAELTADDIRGLGAWDPRRMLVSCTTRRQLVLSHRTGHPALGSVPCDCCQPDATCPPCYTMRALALEWSSHPDYQPEWRAHPVPRQARSA